MADFLRNPVEACGRPALVARVRWTPSSDDNQALTEAEGVTRVARTGAGAYTIYLQDTKVKSMEVTTSYRENDTTHYHYVREESKSLTAGTVSVSHKSVAFASVAAGPTASDTVDEITVTISYRVVD